MIQGHHLALEARKLRAVLPYLSRRIVIPKILLIEQAIQSLYLVAKLP